MPLIIIAIIAGIALAITGHQIDEGEDTAFDPERRLYK